MTRLLGVDVSSYQPPNLPWTIWRAAGVRFAYIRGGIGYVVDHGAERHRQQARAAGMYTGCYWAILDHDSETAHFDPVQSARAFDRLIQPGDELPPMVDVEALGVNASLLSAFLAEFNRLRPMSGVGIYTSQYFWHLLIGRGHWEFSHYPLWIADYGWGFGENPPRLPDIWNDYVGYQFRYKKGYLPGYAEDLDIDLWDGEVLMPTTNDQLKGLLAEASAINATSASMMAELKAMIETPPPPPPAPPVLFRVKVLVAVLNIRSGPGVGFSDIGDALLGTVLPVYKQDVGTGWLRIDSVAERWVSGSTAFVEKVP